MNLSKFSLINFNKNIYKPLIIWLLSRGIIMFAMLVIAPLLPAPSGGIKAEFSWSTFAAWDSNFYEHIALNGYGNNGEISPVVAFLPLFPLLIRILINLGFSFEVAGFLINNIAFLLTLILLYNWILKSYSEKDAKWVSANTFFLNVLFNYLLNSQTNALLLKSLLCI